MTVFWNLLRLVVFAEAAVIWGLTLAIFRLYHRRYRFAVGRGLAGRRAAPRRRAARGTDRRGRRQPFDMPWIGLLPTHVWLVSIGTMMLVASETALVTRGIGQVPHWYGLPVALGAFTLLIAALSHLATYEYRLVH